MASIKTQSAPSAAAAYIDAGLRVVPVLTDASKRPTMGGFGPASDPDTWASFSAEPTDFGPRTAIAILTGPCPAGEARDDRWLFCLDLDGELDRRAAAAALGCSLPRTLATHKRKHLWYWVAASDERARLRQWNSLLGVRSSWAGEGKAPDIDVKWCGGYARELGAPEAFDLNAIVDLPPRALAAILAAPGASKATVDAGAELADPVALSEADVEALTDALIAAWPGAGEGMHDCAKALGGALRRAGAPRRQTRDLARAVLEGAGSEAVPTRLAAALNAWDRADAGSTAYGRPTLARLLADGGATALAVLDRVTPAPPVPDWCARIADRLRARRAALPASVVAAAAEATGHPLGLDVEITHQAVKSLRVVGSELLLRNELAVVGRVSGAANVRKAVALLCRGFRDIVPERIVEFLRGSLDDAALTEANVLDMIAECRAPRAEADTQGRMAQICALIEKRYELRLNTMTGWVELPDGRMWTDSLTTWVRIECEQAGISDPEKPISADLVHACAMHTAEKNAYHPVVEYLESLPVWDGLPRVDALFPSYMRCADTALNGALSRCFMLGAVARALRPGCKNDLMPIVWGEQGGRKSSAIKALAGGVPFYSDAKMNVDHRSEAYQAMGECWIYEVGELQGLDRASQNAVKNMITQQVDRYLPPYGRTRVQVDRRSVMIGTTNEEDCLRDPTGNRRHPVIACVATREDPIDTAPILADRDQLWAEALHRYRAGEPWYLAPDLQIEADQVNEQHMAEDPWDAVVGAWYRRALKGNPGSVALVRGRFRIGDLLSEVVMLPIDRQDRQHQTRMGYVLRRLGVAKMRTNRGAVYQLAHKK